MPRTARPRRLSDGQQLALLPTTVEEDAAQLDLVAEYGVEHIGPSTIVEAFVPTLFALEA